MMTHGKYQTERDLTDAEMATLRQSIVEHKGILQPIAYDEHGNILDGHHRKIILDELGIKEYPRIVHAGLTEEQKLNFARDANRARRHLSADELRVEAAKRLIKTPELSDRSIAKRIGASHTYVSKMRRAMEEDGELATVYTSLGEDGKTRLRPIYAPTARQFRAAMKPGVAELMNEGEVVSPRKALARLRLAEKEERQRIKEKITSDDVILRVDDVRTQLLWIEPESVDLLLCDMPYDLGSVYLAGEVSKLASRVLRQGAACLVMTGLHHLQETLIELSKHLSYHWMHAILTPGAAPRATMLSRKIANKYKPVLWFQKGQLRSEDLFNDVFTSPSWTPADKELHPHGQSVEVFRELVKRHSLPGQTVLDCFNGGGTTAEACIREGRKYIGVDIEPEHIETTKQRVTRLFEEDDI